MIELSGYIDVPLDELERVRHALAEHIRLTRLEAGCILFEVTEDEATPGRFTVLERFSDQAAFDAHQARVKASDWGHISRNVSRQYQIRQLDLD